MAFKMNRSAFSFGKGTGYEISKQVDPMFTKKTVFKKDPPEVTLNQGPELYSGGIPGGPGYIDEDDPMINQMLHPDRAATYVNMPEGTGPGATLHSQWEENVHKRQNEGSHVTEGRSRKIASRISDEDKAAHEWYQGVKDGGAGYSDVMLGAPNQQEMAWGEQFGDLKKRLVDYMGDHTDPSDSPVFWPGEGTDELTLDKSNPNYDKQWKEWSSRKGNEKRHNESNYDWKQRMEHEIETVLNLDNDLKMAANAGYHFDENDTVVNIHGEREPIMEAYILDDVEAYQPSNKSVHLKIAHKENAKLQDEAKRTVASNKAIAEFNDLVNNQGFTATEAAAEIGRTGINAILGMNNARNPYQGETDSILENSEVFRNALANAKEDDFYPASREWDEERWGPNPNDRSVWNAEAGMSHDDYEAQQDIAHQNQLIDQQNQEAAAVDAETQWYDTPEGQDYLNDVPGAPSYEEFQQGQTGGGYQPQTTGGTEEQNLSDTPTSEQENQDNIQDSMEHDQVNDEMSDDDGGYTPQTQEQTEGYTPQSVIGDTEDDEESEESYVEDAEGNYIPQGARNRKEYTPQSAMNKTVNSPLDYSKPNPFRYGSDDYYGFQKKARSHKLGLAKRIFNIYSKDA